MNKELKLLIIVCSTGRDVFTPEELAALINLKFKEGVYNYINRLQKQNLLLRLDKGQYRINESNEKVKTIRFLLNIFNEYTHELLSIHTRRILERFSNKPILRTTDLPYHNLKQVKNLVRRAKIIHVTKNGNTDLYFIRSWEEPVKRILKFFDIGLNYDEEEYRHKVISSYSAFTGTQSHLQTEKDIELARRNLQYYLEGKDFILDKLKNTDHPELSVIGILTENKLKIFTNPFEITRKINDWKIKYVYNTDKIEGNLLTYEEVKTALTIGTEGIRREKKDILETLNSRTALDNVFDTSNEMNVDFIKKLHKSVQQGISQMAGKWKLEDNCIVDDSGALVDTTTPARFVEQRTIEMVDWYNHNKNSYHPLVLASVMHNQFVYIHPFDDGNGRVARLIFNFVLIKNGFFPIIFYNDEKQKYYSALRLAKDGDMKPFVMYCSDLYRMQLELF